MNPIFGFGLLQICFYNRLYFHVLLLVLIHLMINLSFLYLTNKKIFFIYIFGIKKFLYIIISKTFFYNNCGYTCTDYIFYFVLINLINNYKIVCTLVFMKIVCIMVFLYEFLVCDGFLCGLFSLKLLLLVWEGVFWDS